MYSRNTNSGKSVRRNKINTKVTIFCCILVYPRQQCSWGPPGSCRPKMGSMLAPWTLLSGMAFTETGDMRGESTSHRWGSSHKRPMMCSDVYSLAVSFVVRLGDKLSNKQSSCWAGRSCDVTVIVIWWYFRDWHRKLSFSQFSVCTASDEMFVKMMTLPFQYLDSTPLIFHWFNTMLWCISPNIALIYWTATRT